MNSQPLSHKIEPSYVTGHQHSRVCNSAPAEASAS